MSDRYPGYDVLANRHTPSWNEQTRRVIDQRLALPREPRILTEDEWRTLEAVCDRIVPQPPTRPPVPIAAMIDAMLFEHHGDGYRDHRLPPMEEAWHRGLTAFDAEAQARYRVRFHALDPREQDFLLKTAEDGSLAHPSWRGMSCAIFFAKRLVPDIVSSYYGHPTAWNEIGFGGPASPRGYVRLGFDRRDPWEATEAKAGSEQSAADANARIG